MKVIYHDKTIIIIAPKIASLKAYFKDQLRLFSQDIALLSLNTLLTHSKISKNIQSRSFYWSNEENKNPGVPDLEYRLFTHIHFEVRHMDKGEFAAVFLASCKKIDFP